MISHEGHRQRLIGKVKNSDRLTQAEILEVLLFNVRPRQDVNATARELINAFGSLDGVLQADVNELMKIEGVGKNTADYLVCIKKCLDRASGCNSFGTVNSTSSFKRFILSRVHGAEGNALELCFVDADGRVRNVCRFSGKGSTRAKAVYAKIARLISVYLPNGVYAVYYRDGVETLPESSDDEQVGILSRACAAYGVGLYDYCIAARGGEDIFSYFVEDRLPSSFSFDGGYGKKI